MSYNADSCRIVDGELTMDPCKAAALLKKFGDKVPEQCFLYEHAKGGLEIAPLSSVTWCGEGSGHSWTEYRQALEATRGSADIVVSWQSGDSVSGLRVRNGWVADMDVKQTLVPKGSK
jgi:hypothetical protein